MRTVLSPSVARLSTNKEHGRFKQGNGGTFGSAGSGEAIWEKNTP
jgi:hypothetical protein